MTELKVKISNRAAADLIDIATYTAKEWGKAQALKYVSELRSRFIWIAKHPKLGTNRKDLREGYFCYPQGQHLVFYSIEQDHILIIGVLHKRMDYLAHL